MKKIKLVLSIIVLAFVFTNCDKEEDVTNNDQDLLVGKWKLTGLVNISDDQKYLNTVLEFLEDKHYTNMEESGENIVTGSYIQVEQTDTIKLSTGLFEDYAMDYKLLKNDSDSLILEHHYTLDGKDNYLEYHYKRMD